jgi:plastocyanin
MANKQIIILLPLLVILVAIFVLISRPVYQKAQTTTTTQPQTTVTTAIQQGPEIPSELTSEDDLSASINELDQLQATSFEVLITSSGFSPSTLTIKVGDTVTFINKDSNSHWPASDPHPTHTNYPGFDALRPLKTGESYSFTFTKQGAWNYHDHLDPSLTGTIIVQ